MARKARARTYTHTDWIAFDPILAKGEIGYSETSGKIKIGTGSLKWSELNFVQPDTANITTDQVTEGSRLFYTQGRFDTAFYGKNTGHLAEGINLYYTNARADARIELHKAVANGLATLGANSKIPMAQIPDAMLGAAIYQGVWNASTNSPALATGTGTKGYYYVVEVPGTTNIDGINSWALGDWIIFNGSAWQKVDNTDAVISVNGLIGAVMLTTTHIAEGTNLYWTTTRGRSVLIPKWVEAFAMADNTGFINTNYSNSTILKPGLMVLSPTDYGFPEYTNVKASFVVNAMIYSGGTGRVRLVEETAPNTYVEVAGSETLITNTSLQFITSPEVVISPNKKYYLQFRSGSGLQAVDCWGACLKLFFY
jgi:hypothetical protein